MKTSIALIGFMGVGKTTVGRILAEKLNYAFIEIDSHIEQKYGISITRLFEKYGESSFREKEREAIEEISQWEYVVIDCGGGIVLNKMNIVMLKRKSYI
jgi:shikimate kinase